jgi:hypothetical protein
VRIKTKEHLTEYVLVVNKRHLEVYVGIEKKAIKVIGVDVEMTILWFQTILLIRSISSSIQSSY